MNDYWGFIMTNSLRDPRLLDELKIIKSGVYPMFNFGVQEAWGVNLVEVPVGDLPALIPRLQAEMNPVPEWFAHFFRGDELVVVYRERVFNITIGQETWTEALAYGREMNIPDQELEFLPNTREEALRWFRRMRLA